VDRGREHVHPRPAAEVEHALSSRQPREAKVVANTGERHDGLCRQPIEQRRRVAERLRERPPGREVKIPVRLVRHVAVNRRDVPRQLLGIDA
jgi:hypothetical protein